MSSTDMVLIALPLIAATTHAIGFWKYNSQVKVGGSEPNSVTWGICVVLAILNSLSFMAITRFIVALQTFVGAAGCISTFFHALLRGKFEWPNRKEWAVLAISIGVIVVWKLYNPLYANIILIGALFMATWPTWEGVWKNPAKERSATPWLLWGSAYAITTLVTFLDKGFGPELSMPVFLMLAHPTVPVICVYRRER